MQRQLHYSHCLEEIHHTKSMLHPQTVPMKMTGTFFTNRVEKNEKYKWNHKRIDVKNNFVERFITPYFKLML